MVYVIRTIQHRNGVIEKTKFPVRSIDNNKTREDRREINREAKNTGDARRNFARILNNNFLQGDSFVTLDLSDDGLRRVAKRADKLAAALTDKGQAMPERRDLMHQAMEQEMGNLHRRVLRACGERSIGYVYASAVSDMVDQEDTECSARLHIHMVVNAEATDIVRDKWRSMGSVKCEPLSAWASRGVPDWTGLATYIIGQTRVVGKGKRYTISRTAQKPPHKDRIAVRPDAILRAPSGTVLLEQGAYVPGRAQYIRYIKMEFVDKDVGGDDDGIPI